MRLGTFSSVGDHLIVRFSNLNVQTGKLPVSTDLSSENWVIEKLTSNPVYTSTGVEMNCSSYPANAGILSAWAIEAGGFTVSVDFHALKLPTPKAGSPSGSRNEIFLGVVIKDVTYRIARWQDVNGGRYFFQDWPGGKVNDKGGVIGIQGKLRLRRVGDTLFADYWDNNRWVTIGQRDNLPREPAFVRLSIGLFSEGDEVAARFSNLTVKQ